MFMELSVVLTVPLLILSRTLNYVEYSVISVASLTVGTDIYS